MATPVVRALPKKVSNVSPSGLKLPSKPCALAHVSPAVHRVCNRLSAATVTNRWIRQVHSDSWVRWALLPLVNLVTTSGLLSHVRFAPARWSRQEHHLRQ